MAHFAEIDSNLDNVVLRVIVIGNEDILDENGEESEALGIAFCKNLFGEETEWVQTSYNNTFRKNTLFDALYFLINYNSSFSIFHKNCPGKNICIFY